MDEHRVRFYERMYLIRRYEEEAIELYKEGLIGGSIHPAVGQEAVAVGVCEALAIEDQITFTYRGRSWFLAKGGDGAKMLSEVLGKGHGICQGKGGPMHLCDPALGILGANGIVGAGAPIAAGAGLAAQLDAAKLGATDLPRIAVTVFGDGATNQGAVHEALNLAAVWKLPVMFICENNLYGEMTPLEDSVAVDRLTERARGHGVRGIRIDGNEVEEVYRVVSKERKRMLKGGGPVFIEAMTYRLLGHMIGDQEVYRRKEEVEEWTARDPVKTYRDGLSSKGADTELKLKAAEDRGEEELKRSVDWARSGVELPLEQITEDVFSS